MKKFITLCASVIFILSIFAQAVQTPGITVGLLYTDDCQVADGYTLFSPQNSDNTYLIDNCGYIINQWTFSGGTNYTGTYLLEDGSVIKIVASNGGVATYGSGCIERRSWNDILMWEYCGTGIYTGIHSDLGQLPNGNIIAVVQRQHTAAEATAKGINPGNFGNFYKTESVIEIQQTGLLTGTVVWEWHLWDHINQDINSAVTATYVYDVGDEPGKFDGNLINGQSHFNSLNYMADRDHILLSNWLNDEIYIVDHNTTTAEAAGVQGDFLWRWGNPQNYNAGNSSDKRLDGQHNPKLIPDYYALHGGKISVFNNGFSGLPGNPGNGSGACIINAVYDSITNTYATDPVTGAWLPQTYDYSWYGDIFPGDNMSSGIMGGVDVQANGNIMITEATSGRISEVVTNGDVVWVYKTPENSFSIANQGNSSSGDIYKIDKYAPSYPGILNNIPGSLVENNNSVSENCAAFVPQLLDAGISSFQSSSPNQTSCNSNVTPGFQINNNGSTEITSISIDYSLNNGPVSQYIWNGSLGSCESDLIELEGILIGSSDQIDVEIMMINGTADTYPDNNTASQNLPPAIFTDSGNISSNYSSNENQTYVICPNNPYLETVELEFTHVDIDVFTWGSNQTDPCGDYLSIYNGNSIASPVIAAQLCGELSGTGQTPPNAINLLQTGDVFSSTDPTGCLTLTFTSDVSDTDDGWAADLNCISNGIICPLEFNLNTLIPSATYQADDLISSTGQINTGSEGPVDYLVGDLYIELLAGFEADGSFEFNAGILDCDPNN